MPSSLRDVLRALRAARGATAIGLLAAWAGSRVFESVLFGVKPTDPLVYAGVVLVLLATGLAAAWLPARRASRVDPLIALRAE